MTDTRKFALTEWDEGILQPDLVVNEALARIDALAQIAVETQSLAAPPTTVLADAGKCWIVAGSPTGAWSGKAGQIAISTGANTWLFCAPFTGMRADVLDETKLYRWSGSAWVVAPATPVGTPLTSAYVWVGNGSNVAEEVLLSGDVTITNTGVATIANGAVSLAKMADLAAHSLIGNTTGSAAAPAAISLDTDGTLAGNSDSAVSTQKAVKTYVDNVVTGTLKFKGSTDCSGNPNYPAASKGDAYVVSVAGKIGGASGVDVDIGDVYAASADNAGGTQASVGSSWFILEHNLAGALLSANNLSDLANAATARANLGLGTAATQNTGTSGANLVFANGANTWASTQTFTVPPVFTDAAGTRTALGLGALATGSGKNIDGQTFDGTADITVIAPGTHAAASKSTPVDADELPLVDSAASNVLKKLTWANLKATLWAAWGALINSGTSKTTPVDADAFAMMDSAASNATKSLTWANLAAALRQYPPRATNPSGLVGFPFVGVAVARTSAPLTNGALYAAIGYVTKPIVLSAPSIAVTAGVASAVARVGVCTWDAANEQSVTSGLLLDWGTADCSVTGSNPAFTNGAATVTLQPGILYAIVFGTTGGASAPTLTYYFQTPTGIDLITQSTSGPSNLIAYRKNGQGSQISGGLSSTPMTGTARDTGTTAGVKNFVLFNIA